MPLILPNTIANDTPADGDKLQQNFATITDWANQDAINANGTTAMRAPLLLPGAPTQPNQAATKAYVDAIGLIGEVRMYGGTTAPTSWMLCRGQAISRATYSALFAIIGTRFGAGDGSTTFNLPNFQATMPVGYNSNSNPPSGLSGVLTAGVGERAGYKDAQLPIHDHNGVTGGHSVNHTHTFSDTSSGQSANHDHNMRGQGATGSAGQLGLNYIADDGFTQFPVIASTGLARSDHTHTVSGTTSGANVNHTHTIANEGVTATNRNYPPALSINFIMKVQ